MNEKQPYVTDAGRTGGGAVAQPHRLAECVGVAAEFGSPEPI
jgi:hypothetical protein